MDLLRKSFLFLIPLMLGIIFFSLSAQANEPFALIAANPNPAACNQSITFDGSGSYQDYPPRNIVSYEWDWDNDGIYDAVGVTVAHSFNTFGVYSVTLRVTDDNSPPLTDTDSVDVSVDLGNRVPIGNAGGAYISITGQDVSLNGSGSSDPDAGCGDSIVSYAWDLDNDGQFDDATGISPTIPWSDIAGLGLSYPGVANIIGLQVTDSFGATSIDTTSLTIYLDSDGDGVPDPLDGCPSDPEKYEPGICGCGVLELDSDGDQIPDCIDGFPNDQIEKGDISNDLNIDLTDSILALQAMSGIVPSAPVYKQADVNGDGKVGIEEVIYTLQKVSGLRQ
jgi:hypothetical protein